MLAGRNKTLKPQDVLLLLKIIVSKNGSWRIIDLAHDLEISPSEITHGLERLKLSGLIDSEKRTPFKSAALEFLIHGLKYVFPAQMGTISKGIPTAHSFYLNKKFVSDMNYVWESDRGEIKGISISPLYESAPNAAKKDEKLHRLLALIDSLRIGKAREQNYAREQLEKELTQNEL
jgi:hypothetical protein